MNGKQVFSKSRAKQRAKSRRRQEERWARKSGDVTTRFVCPICGGPHARDDHPG